MNLSRTKITSMDSAKPADVLCEESKVKQSADQHRPLELYGPDKPEDIVDMEVELEGVDISQEVMPASAQSFAIAAPPTQADPTVSTQAEQ